MLDVLLINTQMFGRAAQQTTSPDILTRTLAISALAVSLISAAVAILSYRRGGAHMVVSLNQARFEGEYRFVCRASNTRLAATQITLIEFAIREHRKPEYISRIRIPITKASLTWNEYSIITKAVPFELFAGPDLPYKLDGNHSCDWTVPNLKLREALSPYDKQGGYAVRAVLTLGNRKRVNSNWLPAVPRSNR